MLSLRGAPLAVTRSLEILTTFRRRSLVCGFEICGFEICGRAFVTPGLGLMDGVTPNPDNTTVIEAAKFKKDGPRVIGMSPFGVNANTWTARFQVHHAGRRL